MYPHVSCLVCPVLEPLEGKSGPIPQLKNRQGKLISSSIVSLFFFSQSCYIFAFFVS